MAKKLPRKGFSSYILPFLLIILLLGTGWYIIQNKINLDDLQRILQPPEVAKDDKVSVVYQEGENQIKQWSEESWEGLEDDSFLQAGDTIKTSGSGVLVLRFFEDSELRVDKKTEIKLVRIDKNETEGDHLAVELVSGQIWRRGKDANTEDSDFIITTNRQIIQMNKAAVVDVSTNPDRLRVIGGTLVSNIAEKINGTRKPISQLEISGGQQITLDDLTLDQLKAGDKEVIFAIDSAYRASEWYLWNIEKEEKLGMVTEVAESSTQAKEELEKLDEGLVLVGTPKPGEKTGTKLTVSGTYDNEKISQIWVNNQAVTLGLGDEWETIITLSAEQNDIKVTAQEKGSTVKKEAKSFEVNVDSQGPSLGKIISPEVDENGNGTITGDKIELVGEVNTDAQKICVSHNNGEPYCLKQFTAGSKTYRYLGGVAYGNVVTGQNKYSITAYDVQNNISQKTVYYFKDIPKPTEKVIDDSPAPAVSESTAAELDKPVISSPDPGNVLETAEPQLTIKGTVDPASKSLLINGKKATYAAGSSSFEVTITLESGENLIKIQTTDSQGNKSKSATLKAIYLEEIKPSAESEI